MGQSHGRPIVYTDQVNLNHFKLLRVVGKGAFGKVRIVERRDDRLTFALKYIRKDEVVRAENVRNIIRERRMLEHLNHPFLCNLRYSFQDFEYLYLVVDLMNGGDLRFHITRKTFTEAAVRFWIAELACALRYIHSQGIVHRDVKPDNVLLDSDGHVHLADFNVAANYKERSLTSKSGTLAYLAPEVYKGIPYKNEVDWWGLGVLFYECIYSKRPFIADDHEQLARKIMAARPNYPITSPLVETTCVSAIKRLMCKEVHDRIGASGWATFAQHPFFIDIDFKALERKEIPPVFIPSSDKTNFDATYDLEELLLEDAPLEARAKHQKPRPRLKSDATPQELRFAELHNMIEKYFEPFDYKQLIYEKSKNEVEASAKAALATLPSDAGKIDVALSQARRISSSSQKHKHKVSTPKEPLPPPPTSTQGSSKKDTTQSITVSPTGSPPFNSQVDLPALGGKDKESDTTETKSPTDDAISPTTVVKPNPTQNTGSSTGAATSITGESGFTAVDSAAETPPGKLDAAALRRDFNAGSQSRDGLPSVQSRPSTDKPIRTAQRSLSVGHIGMLGPRRQGLGGDDNTRSTGQGQSQASQHPIGVSSTGRITGGIQRVDTDATFLKDKSSGISGFLSRRKRERSNNRKEIEPGVLGKVGARHVVSEGGGAS